MGQWSRFLRLCVVVAIRVRLMNPMRPLKIPLHTKIFLSLTTGLVLCTAVLTATHYRISSRILTAEWESKADEYGRLMEFTFQPLVQSKDRSALNRAISLALLIPGMKSITVIDAQGTIVADSKGQGVGSHLAIHLDALRRALEENTDTGVTWVETKDSSRIRFFLAPIKGEAITGSMNASPQPMPQGAILIGLDLSPLDTLIQSNLYDLLSINGITFVALLLMCWITIRIGVVHSLHRLAETVRATPGSPLSPEQTRSSDEITSLSESFVRMNEALQASESFNRATLNSLPVQAAIVDQDGHLLSVNGAWEQFARDHNDCFPSTGGGLINFLETCRNSSTGYGDHTQEALVGIRAVLHGEAPSFTLDFMIALSKERRWFVLSVTSLQRPQGGAILSHTEVTERRRAEDALLRSMTEIERARIRLNTVYATIPIGLIYVTPNLIIERVSQSMAQFHGRSVEEHVNQRLATVLPPERWTKLKPVLEQVLKTGTAYHGLEEVVSDPHAPDGIRILLSHCDADLKEDGTVRGIHLATQDITAEKQAQKEHEQNVMELEAKNRELDQMAIRDPLTGLYNRRFFDEALTREWQQFQRSGEAFTVIIMDVDAFKAINDDYGHEAGDRALQQVSVTLKANLRESDLIARVGGDEFAALLPRTDTEQSRQVVEKLSDVLQCLRLMTADGDIPMSLSVGTATVPGFPPVTSAAELLRVADKRMYETKRVASARRADAG
jgi:diguanylate cyclase (GGDEF)-like protein/PAS domain S-box-containing protein